MNEFIIEAAEEMKRIDHLVFVSLKYTRTVDVIKSIIERMINAYDFMIQAHLDQAKEEKKIGSYPQSPALRVEALQKLNDDDFYKKHLEFYSLLRTLSRAEFGRRKEFRRHVTMEARLENKTVEVNIDVLKIFHDNTKEFFKHTREQDAS
jgi:hypothetical protein